MAQEELKYTIADNDSGKPAGAQVDVIFTYDATKPNADGSFTVTDASGTYSVLNAAGTVDHTDTITGIVQPTASFIVDNELFIVDNPATTPIATFQGIGLKINNTADTADGSGNFEFYDKNGSEAGVKPTDTPNYGQSGTNNGNPATGVTESAVVACYASGTRIATARGEIAVEHLAVGDMAVTASGEHRSIRWIGHRQLSCLRHPRPAEVQPVRIAAHAFGEAMPSRDLVVSPGHAICVDAGGAVLIPASALVNGASITQESVESVTYWHVELDSHDVILAESLPCESYLEMDNRGFFFAESAVVEIAPTPDASRRSHADFCLPFHADGPLVDAVRARLAARAARPRSAAARKTRIARSA